MDAKLTADIEQLKRLLQAVPAGPWTATDWGSSHPGYPNAQQWYVDFPDKQAAISPDEDTGVMPNFWDETDSRNVCQFIALARNVLPQLLALVQQPESE